MVGDSVPVDTSLHGSGSNMTVQMYISLRSRHDRLGRVSLGLRVQICKKNLRINKSLNELLIEYIVAIDQRKKKPKKKKKKRKNQSFA